MDKITRMLILYLKLIKGEKINKYIFCTEYEVKPRSFDRDIEDLRLFLSESFSFRELLYDRRSNEYYITGCKENEKLEWVEFELIKRVFIDSGILRKDELEGLLGRLYGVTNSNSHMVNDFKNELENYREVNKNAIIKMLGDLSVCIHKKEKIKIYYFDEDKKECSKYLIPYSLRYKDGYIYLNAALRDNSDVIENFRIDKINSFEITDGT